MDWHSFSSPRVGFLRLEHQATLLHADPRPALFSRVNKQSSALVSKGLKSRSIHYPITPL
jgi:hypothetical protein